MLNYVVRRLQVTSLMLLASAVAFCQSQTGSLAGTVLDAHHAAVPDATIDATLASAGITLHTVSLETGLYVFPTLLPGVWTITVEKSGFKKLVRPEIEIFVAQRQTLDLSLDVGDTKQGGGDNEKKNLLEQE